MFRFARFSHNFYFLKAFHLLTRLAGRTERLRHPVDLLAVHIAGDNSTRLFLLCCVILRGSPYIRLVAREEVDRRLSRYYRSMPRLCRRCGLSRRHCVLRNRRFAAELPLWRILHWHLLKKRYLCLYTYPIRGCSHA